MFQTLKRIISTAGALSISLMVPTAGPCQCSSATLTTPRRFAGRSVLAIVRIIQIGAARLGGDVARALDRGSGDREEGY